MCCNTGTSIEQVVAVQFATDTGVNLSLHDLSVRNLSADYDHFMDCKSILNFRFSLDSQTHFSSVHYVELHLHCNLWKLRRAIFTFPQCRDVPPWRNEHLKRRILPQSCIHLHSETKLNPCSTGGR